MIAHVAEASEASGRVVLWLMPASMVSVAAIEAAADVAAAYGSEVETVVVGSGAVATDGSVPVRYVSVSRSVANVARAAVDCPDIMELSVVHQQREAEKAAARVNISCRHTRVEGDAFDRLSEMCQARGPWNIIALTEAPSAGIDHIVSSILANVAGATGVIVAPATASRYAGVRQRRRVSIVVEDTDRLPSMLRAAERLCNGQGQVHVLIAEATRTAYDEVETAARLLTEGRPNVEFESLQPTFGVEGALDFALRRLAPSFVIARFGGALLPTGRALSRTITLTGAPFLLVR